MGTEIVIANPKDLYRQSTDAAGLCKEIVVQTACSIQGRKYVKVEGWQAIAVAHGCILSSRDVERIEGGIRAIGEVRRIADGAILATAEGFVGDTEKTWGNREEYAKRAMAQTRAMSRVGRAAFAHVVVMMNAGLETTPAEEIPQDEVGGKTAAQELGPFAYGVTKAEHDRQIAAGPTPKQEAEPLVDHGTFEDGIKSGSILKQGKNRTGDWTLYKIETEGHGSFTTFSKSVYAKARLAAEGKKVVTIVSRPGPKGPEVEDIAHPDLVAEGQHKNLASVP